MTPVLYWLAMPDPHTHLLEVEVRVGSVSGDVELVMPAWTPGSYLIREFARHVQEFGASDDAGAPLPWRKIDKSTWRVKAGGARGMVVRYRVYANELTVRTSHLDSSHAYVNGASVFMLVREKEREPADLEVVAPDGWRVATSLPRVRGNELAVSSAEAGVAGSATQPSGVVRAQRFRAADYDELVDSPLEIGRHRVLEWEQAGVPHEYAIWGRGEYDADRIVADTRRVIDAAREMFGGELPYERFVFILHLVPEGRGGLEHAASCSLQVPSKTLEGEAYESFIALVAHEYFHVWNGKRIRPEPLGPFDYTRENYTRNLWVVEGITTYYTDLLLVRAALMTRTRYLERLSESISRLQSLPGRHHQTLEDSSFDAWIRLYRPDEHTPNSQVSYYHKGALVAMLLDMEIRRASWGERSLDDVMRLLWERYGSRGAPFPEDPERGVQALAEEVAGAELGAFFDAYVRGTAELDYGTGLEVVGLKLVEAAPAEPSEAAARRRAVAPPAALELRLGIRTKLQGERIVITHLLAGGPAHAAGVNARDELIAIDGVRATQEELTGRLDRSAEGELLSLTLSRRDSLLELPVRVGPPSLRMRVMPREDAPEGALAARADWLRGARAGQPGFTAPKTS